MPSPGPTPNFDHPFPSIKSYTRLQLSRVSANVVSETIEWRQQGQGLHALSPHPHVVRTPSSGKAADSVEPRRAGRCWYYNKYRTAGTPWMARWMGAVSHTADAPRLWHASTEFADSFLLHSYCIFIVGRLFVLLFEILLNIICSGDWSLSVCWALTLIIMFLYQESGRVSKYRRSTHFSDCFCMSAALHRRQYRPTINE